MIAVNNFEDLISNKPEGSFVYHYLLKSYSYSSSGMRMNFGKRLKLTAGINSMGFNALQEVFLSGLQSFEFEYKNSQLGFYLGGEYTLHPNWYLSLAGHFIKGDYNYMAYTPDMMGMPDFSELSLDYNDYVFEGEIKHRFRTVQAGLSMNYSDLGDQTRFQPGIDITWYPAGNLNFYFNTHLDRLMPLDSVEEEDGWIFQGLAGFKIFSYLWMEAHAGVGRMTSWSEKSAYIVYNNQDPILQRVGGNLIIPDIINGLSLNFRYQLQQREHSWEIWDGNTIDEQISKKYLSNSIIGGLSWKF